MKRLLIAHVALAALLLSARAEEKQTEATMLAELKSLASRPDPKKTIDLDAEELKELMEEMSWEDRHQAYNALGAVLHALRDRLTVVEVADLGAQLLMLILGLYYEGWTPGWKPVKESGL